MEIFENGNGCVSDWRKEKKKEEKKRMVTRKMEEMGTRGSRQGAGLCKSARSYSWNEAS